MHVATSPQTSGEHTGNLGITFAIPINTATNELTKLEHSK